MMNEDHLLLLDEKMAVTISNDMLSAHIHFKKADDPVKCTVHQLEEFLKSNRVVYGIKHDVLTQLAAKPQDFLYDKTLIAAGDPPKNGEDGYIKFLFERPAEAKKPTELEGGKVDHKDVNSLSNVRKGQLIAERIPAKVGAPGRAVTGEAIAPGKGKDVRFKTGKNVVMDDERMRLYAAIDGLITKTEKDKINVFPIYEVNGDVDYRIGNIDFVGTVVIRGNVLNGFKIKAMGDIRVTGGAEAAELIAEGSIEIGAGILGHNKGIVKAKRNVKSSFIQEGNVEAGEDVIVSQSILHSKVRAGRNVLCVGSKGLIVGGNIQAGEKVSARTIGNSMSTVTIVEVGVLPELRNEHVELRKKLRETADNLDKTNKALAILDQLALTGNLSQDKLALKVRLNNTRRQAFDEQNELKEQILEIEKSLEDTTVAKVEVASMIYSGTRVVIGRYTRFIKDATQRVHFKLVDGEIVMMPN